MRKLFWRFKKALNEGNLPVGYLMIASLVWLSFVAFSKRWT